MRAWISADMRDMGALGVLAVATLLGVGGAQHPGPPPGQGAPITASHEHGHGAPPAGGNQCSFTTSAGARQQGGDSPGPGNLTVAIPPVAIVRVDGRRLVVTTNTGERPRRATASTSSPPGRPNRLELASAKRCSRPAGPVDRSVPAPKGRGAVWRTPSRTICPHARVERIAPPGAVVGRYAGRCVQPPCTPQSESGGAGTEGKSSAYASR